jgi:hypothetical protein
MIETKTCRECSNKIHAKGLCVLHYNRWRRSDPDYRIKENVDAIPRARLWWKKNKDEANRKRRENPDKPAKRKSNQKYNASHKEQLSMNSRKWADENTERLMLYSAKRRAKKYHVPFTLKLGDFAVPKKCPVLGIELMRGRKGSQDASPTLDRIIPHEGYVKGNIAVISSLANRIKTNATLEQVHSVYIWMVLQTLPLGNYDRG